MTRLAILITLVLAACGGKTPPTRFYQLSAPSGGTGSGKADVALAIQPLDTDTAYDDERIVYRVTPYRLDYYNYHRWSSTPGTLIADFLERSFEHSGRFRTVTRELQAAPVALSGRVIAIEEVDKSKTEWLGRIVIELTLTETESGKVLWTEQFEETEKLAQQSPEGLAQALSKALHRISDRALPLVSDHASKSAQAIEGAKATPSRAARLRH